MTGASAKRRPRSGAIISGADDLAALRAEHESEHVRAAKIVAASNARIAAAIEAHGKALEVAAGKVEPGVSAITSLATAQTLLCNWLKGWRPWRGVVLILLLFRAVNASPDDLPKLLTAIGALLKVASGGAL